MPTVLLTRPQQDSDALAAALAERGIASIISPVITIKRQPVPPIATPIDGIILTSRHALHATAGLTAPCYVVGAHTAQVAQNYGLHVVAQAETAEALAQLLPADQCYYYPSGAHVPHDFTHAIRVIAYTAEASSTLSEQAIIAIRNHQLHGAALFSPRSAQIFCGLITHHNLQEQLKYVNAYCISEHTARQCKVLAWKQIRTASSPNQKAMIALLKQSS